MPRYYVQRNGKWNLFSTIVDDFLFKRFVSFEELKRHAVNEVSERKIAELETLLTDDPALNVMSYEEAMECRKLNK